MYKYRVDTIGYTCPIGSEVCRREFAGRVITYNICNLVVPYINYTFRKITQASYLRLQPRRLFFFERNPDDLAASSALFCLVHFWLDHQLALHFELAADVSSDDLLPLLTHYR